MRRRALAVGAAMMMLTAVNAHAQDDEDEEEGYYEKESSAYVELVGSYARHTDDDDDTGGAGVIMGAHVMPWLSIEGQYDWLEDSSTSLGSFSLKYVALQGRIQPFLKAGLGVMGGRPNHAFLFMGRFGAGASFFLNEQLALTGTTSLALAKHSNRLVITSVGLSYYFE